MAARRATRRGVTRAVSTRTMKRRALKVEAATIAKGKARRDGPETKAQARAHARKTKRYRRLGLCHACASQAAWGHQCGFQKIHDPCEKCLPIVATFPTAGPRGSKWRKCLIRIEYMSRAEAREAGLIA
jgi:hypothetical protein